MASLLNNFDFCCCRLKMKPGRYFEALKPGIYFEALNPMGKTIAI